MAEFDRRALLCGGMAAAVGVTQVQAQAKPDEEPDPPVEFDGKAKNNPKCTGPGKV